MRTKWQVGDSLMIKNRHGLMGGHNFINGEIYEVAEITPKGMPVIIKNERRFKIYDFEVDCVERVAKELANGLNS